MGYHGGNAMCPTFEPQAASEIGSKHGRGVRFLSARDGLPHRPLKSIGEVSELLEETINRVRHGSFDLRAANAIGFLSGRYHS